MASTGFVRSAAYGEGRGDVPGLPPIAARGRALPDLARAPARPDRLRRLRAHRARPRLGARRRRLRACARHRADADGSPRGLGAILRIGTRKRAAAGAIVPPCTTTEARTTTNTV